MRRLRLLSFIVLALTCPLTGCGGLSLPGSTGDQTQDAVLAAGDLGALSCAAFVIQGQPADVQKARMAVHQATAVLASDAPTFTLLEAALVVANIDPRWAPLARAGLQRVRLRTGGADPIGKDSAAFHVAESFVSACGVSLGEAPPA